MDLRTQDLGNVSSHGSAVTAQGVSDLNGLDPREVVDVRFFLKPEELDEAAAIRKVASNQASNKTIMRIICGLGALYIAYLPHLKGGSWSTWMQDRPIAAIFWGALLVLDVFVALGQPGIMKLNRLANRLDLERRICVSHRGIDVTHGRTRQQKSWKDFSFFQETPTLFLLQTKGAAFWTLPKRAIPAGRGDQLQTLLRAKLQRR